MTDSAPPESQLPDEESLDVRELLRVLSRRRWYAITVLVASLAAGTLISSRAKRVYRATTTIMIERDTPRVLGDVREVYDLGTGGYWNAIEYYKTQYEVIRSRPIARRAASALGIDGGMLAEALRALGPESTEDRAMKNPLDNVPANLRRKLRLIGMSRYGTREKILEALGKFDAPRYIASRVEVNEIKDSRLARVSVEHTDPQFAAELANAVVGAYVAANLDQKVDFTRSAVDWLSDQLRELKVKLEQSELALFEFKKDNNIVSVSMEDRQTMIAQTLAQLNASLSEMQATRLAMESQRRRIRRGQSEGIDATVDAVINNKLVQDLKLTLSEIQQQDGDLSARYTADHPKLVAVRKRRDLVDRELRAEIGRILASLDARYQEALDTEARLRRAIAGVKSEALEINKKEIQYSRLKRERDNNQALFELVLKRQKEADLTELLRVNNVRVHEEARPPGHPIRPRVAVNMLAALVFGLVFGLGLAFLVDYLDNTIKTQEQAEQLLRLPFLGIIPAIKGEKGTALHEASERDHYIVENPRSSVAECCRTVRTNLLFMSPDRPARQLLITSSGPREGKSTTVVNLAVTMAQSGARTVVIDTDMRRPRLHKSFSISGDLGVSNVILGNATVSDALQPGGVDGLSVIPCGPIPPNPAELLHTQRFREFVDELGRRFDRVIFDSPPVAAVTDALVLASMVDGVVLVVLAGQTSWQAAKQASRRLEDVGGKIFGLVLNDVDLENKHYGVYYQYYYNHKAGYGDEPKPKAAG